MKPRPVVILLPHRDGHIPAAAATLAAAADAITALASAPVMAVVAGRDPTAAADQAALELGVPVTALEIPQSTDPCDGAVAAELTGLLQSWQPSWILAADNAAGRHLAPVLAARLALAYVPGVETVGCDGDGIVLTRAVHGGKFRAVVRLETPAALITVANAAFCRRTAGTPPPSDVTRRRGQTSDHRRVHLERRPAARPDPGLSLARVVVAAGNGIGAADRLDLVRDLANRLDGAAVAGSRPVCDRGWLPYDRQVGITGATVAPALYVACGISGAAQHIAGMSGAGLVVAINKDPRAAIFQHADIGIVEDLTTFLPLLIDACRPKGAASCGAGT